MTKARGCHGVEASLGSQRSSSPNDLMSTDLESQHSSPSKATDGVIAFRTLAFSFSLMLVFTLYRMLGRTVSDMLLRMLQHPPFSFWFRCCFQTLLSILSILYSYSVNETNRQSILTPLEP